MQNIVCRWDAKIFDVSKMYNDGRYVAIGVVDGNIFAFMIKSIPNMPFQQMNQAKSLDAQDYM